MEWIRPNTITGPVAQGNKYFRRKDIEEKLWHELANGNSVLFLAPRRVGKSSIVSSMAENPLSGFACKYEDIESDASLQDFYRRLVRMIYDSLSNYGKGKSWIIKWWDSWSLKRLGKGGADFEKADVDFREIFYDLMNSLKHNYERVVLFLDEFPDVVLNIYEESGKSEAKQLLDDVRSICHDKQFANTFTLVLLGSVGLAHVVKSITGRSHKINQTHKEYLPPLTISQAEAFIEFLVKDATLQIVPELRTMILEKIGQFIPFHLQLLIEECDDILYTEKRPVLTAADVDLAYVRLLRKNEYFQDWDERLTKYFKAIYPYFHKILSLCANNVRITASEIYDIAVSLGLELEWKTPWLPMDISTK
jgi:uncharacterized protein